MSVVLKASPVSATQTSLWASWLTSRLWLALSASLVAVAVTREVSLDEAVLEKNSSMVSRDFSVVWSERSFLFRSWRESCLSVHSCFQVVSRFF